MGSRLLNKKRYSPGKVVQFTSGSTETLPVEQKCNDCRQHIENIALSMRGVHKAFWDEELDVLVLNFDATETSLDDIELAVSAAGHNTPHHKAKIEFYTDAPVCCEYAGGGEGA